MQLDVKTLFVFGFSVTAILGLLLLFAWNQNRGNRALVWWAFCDLFAASAMALYGGRGEIPNVVSIDLANALLATGAGMAWAGAREFDGRPVQWPVLFAGAALWLAACQVPVFYGSMNARMVLMSMVLGSYTLATAFEFWRGRREPLVSRWPAIALLGLHAVFFFARIPLAIATPMPDGLKGFSSGIFAILNFEGILFTMAAAFILLAMTKERSELRHKTAALVDELTGIANRRAFLDAAARQLKQQSRDPRPVTVLLFDLDRFKRINDRCGHAAGDRVLRLFAMIATGQLRSTDYLGRLGGEEFAAILIGADIAAGASVAERICAAFEAAAREIDGVAIAATVSAGVAQAGIGEEVHKLLERADVALYAAKALGRNRVETLREGERGSFGFPEAAPQGSARSPRLAPRGTSFDSEEREPQAGLPA